MRAELDQYPDLAGIEIMGPEDVLGGDYAMWQYGSGSTTSAKNLQFLQAVGANPLAAAAEAFFCIHDYDADSVRAADPTPATHWNWWVNGWGTSLAPGIPANVHGFTYYGKKSWQTEHSGDDPAWLNPSSGFPGNGAWRELGAVNSAGAHSGPGERLGILGHDGRQPRRPLHSDRCNHGFNASGLLP
ncbi:MAG: hypothetical protein ABSH34_27245 [Verrucomicrobiota bacterium]